MRWIEYLIYFVVSVIASLLVSAVILNYWPAKIKRFFKYVVPVLIFVVLSFAYVLTGERIEDWLAKGLFCWAYPFEACKPRALVETQSPISIAPKSPQTPAMPEIIPSAHDDYKGDQPPSSLKPKRNADKIFLTVTPDYLINLYNDRTYSEGREVTKVYLGKWMRLSGPLGAIKGPNEFGTIYLSFDTPNHRLIFMIFSRDWADRFAVLNPGQNITAICQLKEVSLLGLTMDPCELVSD